MNDTFEVMSGYTFEYIGTGSFYRTRIDSKPSILYTPTSGLPAVTITDDFEATFVAGIWAEGSIGTSGSIYSATGVSSDGGGYFVGGVSSNGQMACLDDFSSGGDGAFEGKITVGSFVKIDVVTGTAPLTIASTTVCANLNADLLDGNHASAFSLAGHTHAQLHDPVTLATNHGLSLSGQQMAMGTPSTLTAATTNAVTTTTHTHAITGFASSLSGTQYRIPRFATTSTLGDSNIYTNAAGTMVGIDTDSPLAKLQINGTRVTIDGELIANEDLFILQKWENDPVQRMQVNFGLQKYVASNYGKSQLNISLWEESALSAPLVSIRGNGNVGIGTTAPSRQLHVYKEDATTSAVYYAQRLSHFGTGSIAANFGIGHEYELENGYHNAIIAADIDVSWLNAGGDLDDPQYQIRIWDDLTDAMVSRLKITKTTTTLSNSLVVENKLTVVTASGYAEMYMYDNSTACAIDTTNVYHAIHNSFGNHDGTLAPNPDSTYFTYKAGVAYAATAFTNYNSPSNTQTKVTITAGHALLAGESITITGTTNYNGTYIVLAAGLTATEFVITKKYVANDATGSVRLPSTIKALIAGIYHASFNFSGVALNNNDVFKWELNKDVTHLDNISARAVWTIDPNYRSVAASGFVSLTAGQYIWSSVKNYSGTGDILLNNGNVTLEIKK